LNKGENDFALALERLSHFRFIFRRLAKTTLLKGRSNISGYIPKVEQMCLIINELVLTIFILPQNAPSF
jgi:hypothetical protein